MVMMSGYAINKDLAFQPWLAFGALRSAEEWDPLELEIRTDL